MERRTLPEKPTYTEDEVLQIVEETAWFSLHAVCRNCGHEYDVEKR